MPSKFDELKDKLAKRPGVTDPAALAAAIGRKKYGAAGMAKKAAAGRRAAESAEGTAAAIQENCRRLSQIYPSMRRKTS
jgi:hypothetical protein